MDNIDNKKKLNEEKIYKLYTLAELAYENHFKNSISNIDSLYPEGWYEKKNYIEKIEIIYEAIKSNTLIVNTSSYKKFIECTDKKYIKE